MREKQQTIEGWTRQDDIVLGELEKTGRLVMREKYVRVKSDTIADYYLSAYMWLTHKASSLIKIPSDTKLPYWIALSEAQRLPVAEGCVSLHIEVPADEIVVIDYNKWGYALNYMYVPDDDDDEREFNEKLKSLGINNEALLFTTDKGNFFPSEKQRILKSWDKIFTPSDNMDENVGCVWEIKKSWITDIEKY